ncbi:MAG: P-loop NTPase fold protein [Desulfovibrio aminophilus]|uniref:KAP family P-loop NTPase fold protein n=1 Tax=Desulfovibrio aminophilus TaxID=81425 RepID=UPI0039EA4A6A
MHIFPPQVCIDDDAGFTSDNDIFNRKPFANQLTNLIRSADDQLVIGLDAPWGEGKTTFVKQWRCLLRKEYNIDSIYLDSFSSDYYSDPLVALSSSIYDFIKYKISDGDDKERWESRKKILLKNCKTWGKAILRAGIKTGVRAITAGAVSCCDVELIKESIEGAAGEIEGKVVEIFEEENMYNMAIEKFRADLTEFAANISRAEEGKRTPLIIFIDELDRCRPDYALDMIEKIKHIFSVPGLVFVLVYYGSQIEQQIQCRYGLNIDAHGYLAKFINLRVILPKNIECDAFNLADNDVFKYTQRIIKNMKLTSEVNDVFERDDIQKIFSIHASMSQFSLRDVERIMTYIVIFYSLLQNGNYSESTIVIILAMVRHLSPKLYSSIAIKEAKWADIEHVIFPRQVISQHASIQNIQERIAKMWKFFLNEEDNEYTKYFNGISFRYNMDRHEVIPYHVRKMSQVELPA